jgi:DNA repair ATPase RecN
MSETRPPPVTIKAPAVAHDVLPAWRRNIDANSLSDATVVALDESARSEARFIEQVRERTRAATELLDRQTRETNAAVAARHAAEQLSEEERRDLLRAAISEHQRLAAIATTAGDNLARVQQRIDQAESELASVSDLDQRVTAWNADQIRQGLDDEPPYELTAAQRERSRLMDRIDTARTVQRSLQAEATAAQQELQQAAEQCALRASYVVLASADLLADELQRLEVRTSILRMQLTTAAATWLAFPGGTTNALGLSVKARDILMRSHEPPQPNASYSTDLRNWFARLQSDPDATLTDVS